MALLSSPAAASSFCINSFTKKQPTSNCFSLSNVSVAAASSSRIVKCSSNAAPTLSDEAVQRRSGNYSPPIWSYDDVQSLHSQYSRNSFTKKIDELKGYVVMLLDQPGNSAEQLELIASLHRLGLAYHFQDKISTILANIFDAKYGDNGLEVHQDLFSTALEFRLLREYGYKVPQEVFNVFKNEHGNFKECICEDVNGIISLYEAAFLAEEGESILEDARDFSTKFLRKYVEEHEDNDYYSLLASHALELPLRWRMLRLESRWFIDVYQRAKNMNPLLLELAKLDFNIVQIQHQEDLKYASRWWKSTGLGEELSFARDRLMVNFFWTVGFAFQPDVQFYRRIGTKVNAMITTIDDVYDVYGTLDELEQFTDAVERWDASAIEQLPNYMKICFLALHNSFNEMGYDILKQQKFHVIPFLKKAWADLCKSYLVEARWYHSGYKPTLQEYMDNAWISISAPVILVHAYSAVVTPITEEAIECVKDYPDIIRWSSMILRLVDDLGTSSDELKRGDVPKSIQCYMNETGVSESEARDHIHYLIGETWKKMNKDSRIAKSKFPQEFIDVAMNVARTAQCIYQYGDGHGNQSGTKDHIKSLLIESIPCI